MASRHFQALWLSNVHPGTNARRAADLHHFRQDVSADTIYLVGDVVDLKRMKSRPILPTEHRLVIGRLMALAGNGTRVVFIPAVTTLNFDASPVPIFAASRSAKRWSTGPRSRKTGQASSRCCRTVWGTTIPHAEAMRDRVAA